VIDQRLHAREYREKYHERRHRVGDVQLRAEGAEEEVVGTDVDRAEHGDEAQQVEPGREPAREAIAENGAPVIQAAGGRKAEALRQRKGKHTRNETPSGQPRPIAAPPAPEVAWPSELMPPDRMQMIENEMAKLEKRLIDRSSSWA
jgi:hypothetical protein